jgi:hypothetical protein
MTSSAEQISPAEKNRRAQLYARLTYVAIVVVFLSVCAVAVGSTMYTESHKETFKAIHVSKPISFFDNTYVDKKPSEPKP